LKFFAVQKTITYFIYVKAITMYAAVIETWGKCPKYTTFNLPPPKSHEVRIKVLAAAVHVLVRSRASGKHYSVVGTDPPYIPGTDGVGRTVETNELVYFSTLQSPTGSFADYVNIDKANVMLLGYEVDVSLMAAIMNPALSSWMALTTRAGFTIGAPFSVAIVGATGVSGHTSVQLCKAYGATEIISIGKPGLRLEKTKKLGATNVVGLADDADYTAAANVDLVLDYLWGDIGQVVLSSILSKRKNKSQRLTWIHTGALAGDKAPISAAKLRGANLVFMGSGIGSWSFDDLREQLPVLLNTILSNEVTMEYAVKKIEDVGSWWDNLDGPRVVVKL
jgi:NADPH:quinone reductase-like Zn-dependent oxidoreductase